MNAAVLYVAAGALLGPIGLGLVAPDFTHHGPAIEALTEAALLVALFAAGLRLRIAAPGALTGPLRFTLAAFLASLALIATSASALFGFALPAALLVAAMLSPTDPLLSPTAPMTGGTSARALLDLESALTTILAIPVLLFALGLAGDHDLGSRGLTWLAVDVAWAIAGGLAVGWGAGAAAYRLLTRGRAGRETELPEELAAVATVALAAGGAMLLGASSLAAAFAAGLALANGGRLIAASRVPRPMTRLHAFAGRLEHIGAAAALLLLGALVQAGALRSGSVVLAVIVLIAARPIAAQIGLAFGPLAADDRQLAAWFGMRGIVSIYALAVAVNQGLDARIASEVASIVPFVVAVCVAVQGLSATRLLGRARFLRS